MKRSLAASTVALAMGLIAAACSSKVETATISNPFGPRMCAVQSACRGPAVESFATSCQDLFLLMAETHQSGLGSAERLEAAQLDCLAGATDCAAVNACSQATPAQAALCAGTTGTSLCSGNVLVVCDPSPSAIDCAAAGATCFADGDHAACGIGPCDPAHPLRCDGDLVLYCAGGALQSMSCASSGEFCPEPTSCMTQFNNTCVVGAQGLGQCVGSGAPCDEGTFQSTCEGTVIQGCSDGAVARFDCARYGLTCQPNPDGSLGCGGTATECDATTPESCAGSVLTYCFFGKVTTLDCKQYGLSGCATTTQDGSTWAQCTE